jgi:shikimate dehydrogenase
MMKFALFGNSIGRSFSPYIYTLFAKQAHLAMNYSLVSVNEATVQAKLTEFIATGGCGANITAPCKEIAYQMLGNISTNAKVARAVNTLKIADNIMYGDNTDGVGLINDLHRQNIAINNKKIIILGAGGAARGIIDHLLQQQPHELVLVNRDLVKAEKIANEYSKNINVKSYAELACIKADLLINATSSTLPAANELAKFNFADTICYDLHYFSAVTPFLQLAQFRGAKQIINGLGMLVEQAAAAFDWWHNFKPATQAVFAQLQQKTGQIPANCVL